MAKQSLASFARELAKHDAAVSRAFLEAVQDIKSTAQLRVITDAIERNDVQSVINAIQLGSEFFAPLDRALGETFNQGALWQLGQLPKKSGPQGRQLVVRFDHRNPRAEQAVRSQAGQLITEITDDIRVVIAATVEEGIADGRGSDAIARDLIGAKSGNQRIGGLIGLHSRDAEAVRRARAELLDPATLRAYLRRTKSPGRATVRAALRRGEALTKTQAEKVTRQYADRLLRVRAKRIARTEAHHGYTAGQYEALRQAVDRGEVPADAIKLTWQATPSVRTRDSHLAMNKQVIRFGEYFVSPISGALFRYPGDTSMGAPASETVNCRCGFSIEIDYVRLAA